MEGRATYQRIAGVVRTTSASLCKWIGWFRQGGLDELLGHANGAKGGKAPRFSPQQWERFRAELGQRHLAHGAQCAALAQGKPRFGDREKGGVPALGKARNAAQGGPPLPHQKDPVATEAFKTGGLDAKLAALALPPRTPVRVS